MRKLSLLALSALCLLPAPALAAGVNNYNPTEGFVANGLAPGAKLVDVHLTAAAPAAGGAGIDLAPSVGFAMGLGDDWEFGLTTGLNAPGVAAKPLSASLDTISAYFHGPLWHPSDRTGIGLVVGANAPAHAGIPWQTAAEGIFELDPIENLAIALNLGYLRDFTAVTGNTYENLNFTYQLGAWTPYLEFASSTWPDGSQPTSYVVRGDLGYALPDGLTLDANLGYTLPAAQWLPSLGGYWTF